jgi:hypothetical protein
MPLVVCRGADTIMPLVVCRGADTIMSVSIYNKS